jgi:hypothetical protein
MQRCYISSNMKHPTKLLSHYFKGYERRLAKFWSLNNFLKRVRLDIWYSVVDFNSNISEIIDHTTKLVPTILKVAKDDEPSFKASIICIGRLCAYSSQDWLDSNVLDRIKYLSKLLSTIWKITEDDSLSFEASGIFYTMWIW